MAWAKGHNQNQCWSIGILTFWSKYNIFFVENVLENVVFKCQSVGSSLDELICYDEWQFVFTRNTFE